MERPVPYREKTFFYVTHERNPGLIGGKFSHNRAIALAAPLVATGMLGFLYRHLRPASRLQAIGFGAVAGGAVGNVIDRMVRGEVVDFLQVHFYFVPFRFPWKFWPAFNLADVAICFGVILLVITWRTPVGVKESDAPHTA